MSTNRLSGKAGGRLRAGQRAIVMPRVRSMTDAGAPAEAGVPTVGADRQPSVDRGAVQYLDRVRAIFRPTGGSPLAPGLERFIGTEDIFRHVGAADFGHGSGPMMQCPSHWADGAIRVPIGDLEILEVLEDQDVRAG